MNRLDYLLTIKDLIDKEIANMPTGEIICGNVKLHQRQVRIWGHRCYTDEYKTDWTLSIQSRNIDTGFVKWNPIISGKSREEVIERAKVIANCLNEVLEEVKEKV